MFPSRRLSCQMVAHPNLLSNHAILLQFHTQAVYLCCHIAMRTHIKVNTVFREKDV